MCGTSVQIFLGAAVYIFVYVHNMNLFTLTIYYQKTLNEFSADTVSLFA